MNQSKFITSQEVATELGVSKSHAYKVMRELNKELKSKGFMIIAGRVSRLFFEEKFYGIKEVTTNAII